MTLQDHPLVRVTERDWWALAVNYRWWMSAMAGTLMPVCIPWNYAHTALHHIPINILIWHWDGVSGEHELWHLACLIVCFFLSLSDPLNPNCYQAYLCFLPFLSHTLNFFLSLFYSSQSCFNHYYFIISVLSAVKCVCLRVCWNPHVNAFAYLKKMFTHVSVCKSLWTWVKD